MPDCRLPLVSVVVPNWNGERFLPSCLDSLRAQTYPRLEIVVADGASRDGSQALLGERYPEVCLVALNENRGFAGNVNAGILASHGDFVALLNNDAVADAKWIAELVAGFDDPSIGSIASKMLLFDRPDVLNATGDYMRRNGLPGNRGIWERDQGQYDRSPEIFGACGGAVAYRRSMLDDIGLFDERLFYQCEDVDLSYRAQLAGYRCRYLPGARVYHRLGGTGGGAMTSYYVGRNFIWVLLKNTPGRILRRYVLKIVWAQVDLALRALWHGREPAARASLRGQATALLELPSILRARRDVQRRRRTSDRYIESMLA
jgi:GT2 family glycosyltransferase